MTTLPLAPLGRVFPLDQVGDCHVERFAQLVEMIVRNAIGAALQFANAGLSHARAVGQFLLAQSALLAPFPKPQPYRSHVRRVEDRGTIRTSGYCGNTDKRIDSHPIGQGTSANRGGVMSGGADEQGGFQEFTPERPHPRRGVHVETLATGYVRYLIVDYRGEDFGEVILKPAVVRDDDVQRLTAWLRQHEERTVVVSRLRRLLGDW